MAPTDKSKGERRLIVNAIGRNRADTALKLISDISRRECQIIDCHLIPLADCISVSLLVAGNWSALGKLETTLPKLAAELNLMLQFQAAESPQLALTDYRPYAAEIIGPVSKQLLSKVFEFFRSQDVIISELTAQDYRSAHTGAAMSSIAMVLHIPVNQHPQSLREAYMDLCDELNADGILDPIKS